MLRARVAALAVDDHARGEHEAPAEAARAASARSSCAVREVVVADVVGDVAEVDAEPDHRRLVADGGDAVDAARAATVGIAQVALEPLGAAGSRYAGRSRCAAGRSASSTRTSCARAEQRVDDVGADEAGAAGDEDQSASGEQPTGRIRSIATAA